MFQRKQIECYRTLRAICENRNLNFVHFHFFYIAKEKPLIDKTRFYAATFGKDYEHIIEKYEAGMEIDSFCQSVMLDDKDEIINAKMAGY